MNESKILADIQSNHNSSKQSKVRVDNKVQKWSKLYNGDKIGNEVEGRSQFVVKDVKKLVKSMSPSIIEPFIASDAMIKATAKNVSYQASQSYHSDILNHQYNYEFDKLAFIRKISYILPKEGTVWIRTFWDFKEDVKRKPAKGLSYEELVSLQEQGVELEDIQKKKNGLFDVVLVKRKMIYNKPSSMIVKNESVFTDPTAESDDDMGFVIYEYDKSLSNIKSEANIYNKLDASKLQEYETHGFPDTSLGAQRLTDTLDTGRDYSYTASNSSSRKIKILEYWGEYDIDGTGINKQIVCSWIKGTSILLRLEENPYPGQEIPFIPITYDMEPFSIWGNGIADIVGDNQNLHTAMMRGFIENMSLANNGQKLIQKGSIDYVNMAKLHRGDKYVEVNNLDGVKDGSYNNMPPSAFNLYEMITQESELLSGVNRYLEGIDNATIGRTAAGVNMVMSAAQRHLSVLVSVIANGYSKMFEKWYKYNQAFLDDGQSFQIAGELAEVRKEELEGEYRVDVNVRIDAMNQQKVSQINMLMQQLPSVGDKLPPDVIPSLVAEMFDGFGQSEKANKIRNYKPEVNPIQEEMEKLSIEKQRLELEKMRQEVEKLKAEVDKTDAETLDILEGEKDEPRS